MRRGFFAILLVGLILIAAGCGQSGNSAVSESKQILPTESFETENLSLLERMEYTFDTACKEAAVELYTSAQVAADGQMGWDTGDQWNLLVQQEHASFVLYDEYVQYGEVQFWISYLNPEEIPGLEPEDLEQHIYVMVTTGGGFTMYDYLWDAENTCFWKSVSLQLDHQWITQHSNKYSFPASFGTAQASAESSVSDLAE